MERETELVQILSESAWFRRVLEAARSAALPDWLVGGGVIRTLVWDRLSGRSPPTPIPDVDVAFFDPSDLRRKRDEAARRALARVAPDVPWDATNQAAVHTWYRDKFGYEVSPLISSADGVATWPETATSVAVRLDAHDHIGVVAPLGLSDLLELVYRRNARRVSLEEYRRRFREKRVQERWPRVRFIDG
jgi:uncharacterized protein